MTLHRRMICFDLDNTLVLGNRAQVLAYEGAFRKHHLPAVPQRKILEKFGIVGRVLVLELYPFLSEREVTKVVRDHDRFLVRETCRYVRAVPGVVSSLMMLKKRGYHLALVSNSRHRTIHALLKCARVPRRLFDVIVGNDDVLHPKPAPDEIYKAEHLMHLKADYMVGDTIYDILAAKKAKVKAISVLTGNQKRSLLKRYRPYAIVKSVADVQRFLEKTI